MVASSFTGTGMVPQLHKLLIFGCMFCLLVGCFRPPYNNFRPDHEVARRTVAGAGVGAAAGTIAASTLTGVVVGGFAGGGVGALIGLQKDSKKQLIKDLKKQDIQYVHYGDTMTLVVPTDKYFIFNSPRLNDLRYPALENVIKLLSYYPDSPIYVAAFTDNVGSKSHKRLMSQAQAETMMTFLWANGVASQRLKAEGYSDKNDIGDNRLMHGSAFNRRVEIQWFNGFVAYPNGRSA